jgi:GNAT superfamily N-acetyltransferase
VNSIQPAAATAFVSISDLIEHLETLGSEHSVAIALDAAGGAPFLIVADPYTTAPVGQILLTTAGCCFPQGYTGTAPDNDRCPACGWQEGFHEPGCHLAPSFDEPEGPYASLALALYSDALCAGCKNALTVGEAADGERHCGPCARDRRYAYDRLVARVLDDESRDPLGYYRDPLYGGYADLSAPYQDDGDGLAYTLKKLWVPTAMRGKGLGTALLALVTDDADTYGATLHLEVAAEFTHNCLDNDALAAWYGRHGFVPTPGRAGWMQRPPANAA